MAKSLRIITVNEDCASFCNEVMDLYGMTWLIISRILCREKTKTEGSHVQVASLLYVVVDDIFYSLFLSNLLMKHCNECNTCKSCSMLAASFGIDTTNPIDNCTF